MSTLEVTAIVVGILAGTAGVAGFFLSIGSLWWQWSTTRPHIVVRPGVWNAIHGDTKQIEENIGVMEVCNVGQVSVVGSTIGFLRKRGQKKGLFCVTPQSINGVKWTDELKPQCAAMLRFKLEGLPNADTLGRAFAKTIIGDKFKASRRDMWRFAKQCKAARLSQSSPAASDPA